MKKTLSKIGIVLIVLISAFVVVGFVLPTKYTVSREVTIHATPEAVHRHVGNLDKWEAWSPWKEGDPTLEITPGQKRSGVGASQSWVGEDGDGALTVTMSDPDQGIEYDLAFEQGKYQCKSAMLYDATTDSQTKVTWTMSGDTKTPFIGGYFALMMDSMVGPMFDRGLEKLKGVVEDHGKKISPKSTQ